MEILSKKTVYFLWLILFPVLAFSQNPLIDSLQNRLQDTEGEEKIKTLIQLSYHHLRISIQKSLEYSQMAMDYSAETGNKRGIARASLMIGSGYNEKGEFTKAIEYQTRALEIFVELADTAAIGITHNNLGMNYQNLGQYDKAIEHYRNSYKIAKQLNNSTNLFYSLINIGIIYDEWKKFSLALEHYRNALAIAGEIQNRGFTGISMQNLGYVYLETEEYDSALFYFDKSLKISNEIGDNTGKFNTLINRGEVFIKVKEFSAAIDNFNQALSIAQEAGNNNNIILASLKLGEAYRLTNRIDEARTMLNDALNMSQKINDPKLIKDSWKELSAFYSSVGDYRMAYASHIEYTAIKDTLFNRESRHELSEMQTLFELDKKEREIEIQNLRIEKQRNRIYYILSVIVVLLVLSYLLFNRYKLKQKHFRIELEKKNIEIEQRLLRTQMNPHFIFNSLNSINSFISDNNSEMAQSFLSKFARLMRYILEHSRKTVVLLSDEINTLKLNLELEQLRFDNRFQFQIKVDDDIDPENTYIPPMLIQPFIENAILHGLAAKEGENGSLLIHLKSVGELMLCVIEDNGIGREKAAEIKKKSGKGNHKSLGMQVTKERLSILTEKYKQEITYKITDVKDADGNASGTKVELTIPCEVE